MQTRLESHPMDCNCEATRNDGAYTPRGSFGALRINGFFCGGFKYLPGHLERYLDNTLTDTLLQPTFVPGSLEQ